MVKALKKTTEVVLNTTLTNEDLIFVLSLFEEGVGRNTTLTLLPAMSIVILICWYLEKLQVHSN